MGCPDHSEKVIRAFFITPVRRFWIVAVKNFFDVEVEHGSEEEQRACFYDAWE
jgi:hypothetical protein